jgi:predicted negative regulator of RcsB-dependent stress response
VGGYDNFCVYFILGSKEGTVGTTKLTRKEILAEDPVHEAIVRVVDFFKENSNKIGIAVAIIALVAVGVYGGIYYLDKKDTQAQEELGKGIDFYHGEISAKAKDDPYGNGKAPTFRSEKAKYEAAAKIFSSVVSQQSYSKTAVVARYYLGLSQLQLGQNKEAIQNLEQVANNSKDRAAGYLAKRVLAGNYYDSGNFQAAQALLDGMIKDPQCDLPKEDLSLLLSRALVAQGKRDQAIKILKEATTQGTEFSGFKQKLIAEMEKLQSAPKTGSTPKPALP